MASITPTNFNKTRAAFMERISGANIPALAFKLAYLIVYRYANRETQLAYPSQTTLATDLGVSISTIKRLIDILERHGLVVVPGDGRGKSSRYWIDEERVSQMTSFPARKGVKKGCHPMTKKGVTGDTRTKKRTNIPSDRCLTAPCQREGERDRASRESDSPPGVGGAADAARAPGKSPATASLASTAAPDSRHQQEEGFAQLRAVWARPWPDDDAADRHAFALACREVKPGALIAAATVFVAAVDSPRFLPPLARWLDGRGWTKPPPQRPRRSAPRPHQRNGQRRNGKVNVANMFFAIADEDERRAAP
jgi:hypothetical protein